MWGGVLEPIYRDLDPGGWKAREKERESKREARKRVPELVAEEGGAVATVRTPPPPEELAMKGEQPPKRYVCGGEYGFWVLRFLWVLILLGLGDLRWLEEEDGLIAFL